ncbi:MAG: ABC transporter permease, partial [Clostridia bacterium]|nr:ABC transporter permease [Clostridia bacterium]
MIASLKSYRYLLVDLVSRDIKTKYRRSVLGILWSVLNP